MFSLPGLFVASGLGATLISEAWDVGFLDCLNRCILSIQNSISSNIESRLAPIHNPSVPPRFATNNKAKCS